jgi:putative hemolysin
MGLGLEILVVLLLIALNGLFSMGELALVSARPARLAVLARKGVAGAALAHRLADDPQRFLPTVQVGITLVAVLIGVFGGARIAVQVQAWLANVPVLQPAAETLSLALVVMVTTYLTMVLGELVPKRLALRRPEHISARVAPAIIWMARASAPVMWLLDRSSAAVLRLFGLHRAARRTVTEEELRELLEEGTQAGVLRTEELDMIERLLRLADKPVRAIMTPRTKIAWVNLTDSSKQISAALRSMPHSRFVVCGGSVDNVVGVVEVKDILDHILDGGDVALAAALRQPMVVPDTATALDALERLRSDPTGLALVVDEYGSFEGVVTAADVLEAIVGDSSDAESQSGGNGGDPESTLVIDGMMPVDELKSRLSLPILPAEGSYYTLAGLLLALLRRIPQLGDRIVFSGWRFEVLEMDGRRVHKVQASREPPPSSQLGLPSPRCD